MTGADLDDHLLDAYLFLNLNYEPGDEVYLGFSRGAYTVRSLAGLLRKCVASSAAQVVDKARAALELYRHREVSADLPSRAFPQRPRDRLVARATVSLSIRRRSISAFAMSACGTLSARLASCACCRSHSVSTRITASTTPRFQQAPSAPSARHAVAIDEHRAAGFAPTLWTNIDQFQQTRRALAWRRPGSREITAASAARIACAASRIALRGCSKAEQMGLQLAREPGSVISGAMAEIDPITTAPLQGQGGRFAARSHGLHVARWP